jgi:integrase
MQPRRTSRHPSDLPRQPPHQVATDALRLTINNQSQRTFRHTVGTLLAELGEHQLTIRDYLRHSNLSVTNKYLQAASKTKRTAQARLIEAIVPVHLLPTGKTAEAVAPLLHPDSKTAEL